MRITDLRDLDVNAIRFDFDLTFACLLMHADGTIYHRYGSRGPDDAHSYLSMRSLTRLLHDTLPEHAAYQRAPTPPPAKPRLRAIDLPVLATKIQRGQRIDCVHCHTVHDAEHVDAVLNKRWQEHELYIYPDPARIGLTLATERQSQVTKVTPGSAAAIAGMRSGDELLSLGKQRHVRTLSDVQWALHNTSHAATTLSLRYRRAGEDHTTSLKLPSNWQRCPPEQYAWRPYKWLLSPRPGFGGPTLNDQQKRKLGLPTKTFALRVNYIVNWGENAHRGRAVSKAGLRKGDILLSFAGKHDFQSAEHFHAWVPLTQEAGQNTTLTILRQGKRLTLHYNLPH